MIKNIFSCKDSLIDGGSDSFILENGKVTEWWSTLAQDEMKEE